MAKRATLAELMEFANAVREAGGGNPLDALMPAVPEDPKQCLIARNLNFNCRVAATAETDDWVMVLENDPVTRDKIVAKLGLKPITAFGYPAVVLPAKIGRVAEDFDACGDLILGVLDAAEDDLLSKYLDGNDNPPPGIGAGWIEWEKLGEKERKYADRRLKYHLRRLTKSERDQVRDLLPYIQGSSDEARKLATFVNPDGTVVR